MIGPYFEHYEEVSPRDAAYLKSFGLFVDEGILDGGPAGRIVFWTKTHISEDQWAGLSADQVRAKYEELYTRLYEERIRLDEEMGERPGLGSGDYYSKPSWPAGDNSS